MLNISVASVVSSGEAVEVVGEGTFLKANFKIAGLPFKKKTVDFTQIAGTILCGMYPTIGVKGSRTTFILFRLNSVKFASSHQSQYCPFLEC